MPGSIFKASLAGSCTSYAWSRRSSSHTTIKGRWLQNDHSSQALEGAGRQALSCRSELDLFIFFSTTVVLDLYPYWKCGKIPCDSFYWYSVTASVITMGYCYQTASCCFIWLEDISICPLLHHTLIPCLEKTSVSLLLSASFLARHWTAGWYFCLALEANY